MITLQCKRLPQCMKPKYLASITNCILPLFSDASQSRHGQCHIRFLNDKVQIHCCSIIGKSRVTPLKLILVSRLGLTAVRQKFDVHVDDEIFWTDGQVVLTYINSDVRRFKSVCSKSFPTNL